MLVSQKAAAQVLTDNLARIVSDARHRRLAELVRKMDQGHLSAEEKDEFRGLQKMGADSGREA